MFETLCGNGSPNCFSPLRFFFVLLQTLSLAARTFDAPHREAVPVRETCIACVSQCCAPRYARPPPPRQRPCQCTAQLVGNDASCLLAAMNVQHIAFAIAACTAGSTRRYSVQVVGGHRRHCRHTHCAGVASSDLSIAAIVRSVNARVSTSAPPWRVMPSPVELQLQRS